MNQVPPDKEDTPEVRGSFADLVAKVRRSNDFFNSRKPLGMRSEFAQVTQMTQEDDIEEDDSSVTSQELAPMPTDISKKNRDTTPSSTTTNSSVSQNISSSTSSSSSSRTVTRSVASRINSAKWHSKIGVKKKRKPPRRSKTAVKVQLGALVKKRMRVTVGKESKMAMVFGTVVQKCWNRKWQVKFENDYYKLLKPEEFEVVSNDSTQKQLDINSKNEISLVTPIEKHIGDFLASKEKDSSKSIDGKNLKEDIDEESVE